MQIPLIKGDRVDSKVDYRDALPTNMTVVNHPIKGAAGYMYQWFGLSMYATGFGIDRGARWVSRSTFQGHYRVSGNSFIKVNSGGSVDDLGVIPGFDQARIAFSFNNIAIVASQKLYYYNPTDGLREINDPQVGSPIDIVWADGIFILTDGEDLYHSTIADEELYDPLDFGNAQFRPDPTFGLGLNEDNELIAYGETTTEYFVNQGTDDFTYSRINLKAIKLGILGTHCKIELNGKWYCVSRREETSPSVNVIQGGGFKKISSREIDKVLSSYSSSEFQRVTMDAMEVDAIRFVVIHLPDKTLLFNENTSESMGFSLAWSELKSDVLGDLPFRGKNFVRSSDSSKWIGGDRRNGNIGFLDDSVATHYDEIAEWLLFTPLVRLETLSTDKLEVETIPGVAPADDATLFISDTRDGVWYSNEYIEGYGDNYDYSERLIFRNLGYVEDYISWKLRGASRSRMCFAFLNIEAS